MWTGCLSSLVKSLANSLTRMNCSFCTPEKCCRVSVAGHQMSRPVMAGSMTESDMLLHRVAAEGTAYPTVR